MKLIFVLIIISMSFLVGAITLDSPNDNSYHSLLNIDLTTTADLDNSNVSFFVNNESSFSATNEVCLFVNNNGGDELNCTFAFTQRDYLPATIFNMRFDNHTGNLIDSIGSMNMVFNGNPTYNVQGGASNGYYNYSINGFIEDLSPSFTLAHTDDFSLGAWVRVPEEFISSNIASVQGHSCNTRMLFGITSSVVLGFGSVALCTDDDFLREGSQIRLGVWEFIAATYDGTTHDCKTYINGELTASGNCWDGNGFSTTTVWRIGGGDGTYIGDIDEAWVVKNLVMSEEQINAIYKFGEGTYYWKVNSTNGTDTSTTGIQNFTLDITKPILSFNFSDSETSDSSISYNLTVVDSSPVNTTLDVNNVNIKDEQSKEIIDSIDLIFGKNNFVATAIDFAGNFDSIDTRIYRIEDGLKFSHFSNNNISFAFHGENNISRRFYS